MNKYALYTTCCDSSIYRLGKVVYCQQCQLPAKYNRVAIADVVNPVKKKPPKQVAYEYKPVYGMTPSERIDEATKRRQSIEDYKLVKPNDSAERKFIGERIRWNEERIATLLG